MAEATDALTGAGADARGYPADVTREDEVADLGRRVAADLGVPDIIVNSQGTTIIKPAVEVTGDEYDAVMQVNLRSVFFAWTLLAPPMLERGSGSIVNIASLAAHRGWRNAAVYAMSKHGILGLTRTLAAEWAASGVRVNSISPGVFLTELNRERMPAARKEAAMIRTPAGRFGEVEELAGTACYLASDRARYVTGTDVAVDGGYLACGL